MTHMGEFFLLFAAHLLSWESVAQIAPLSGNSLLEGMLVYLNSNLTAVLCSGYFLWRESIIWPFRVYSYLLPFRYAMQSLVYSGVVSMTLRNAVPCAVSASCPRGFQCVNQSVTDPCFGFTGSDVLTTYNAIFELVTATNYNARNAGILCAFAASVKLNHLLALVNSKQFASLSVK